MGRIHLRFGAAILAALSFLSHAIPAIAQEETSVLAGTVVGPDGSRVKNAVVWGLYVKRGRRPPAPIKSAANAVGEIRIERKPQALWLIATSSDGQLAGRTEVPAEDKTVTVKLRPAATVVGRLVVNDAPVAGAHLACEFRLRGTNFRGGVSTIIFEVPTAETASDGRFAFPGLLVGEQYNFRVKDGGGVSVDKDGTTVRSWSALRPVKVEAPGQIDMGYLELPLPQCVKVTGRTVQQGIDFDQLAVLRFYAKADLARRISAARDDARLQHQKVMLVLGDPKAEATRSLVALLDGLERAEDFERPLRRGPLQRVLAALRTNLAQEAGIPEVDVTQEFTRPLRDFQRVNINVKDKAAADHLTKTYSINPSKLVLPALAVLADDGSIAAVQSVGPKGDSSPWDAKALRVFLRHHRLPVPDAEELLTAARHRAVLENKRILLQQSDARSYASRLLTRFLHKQHPLFDRDYIYVALDADRSTKGTEVIARFRKSGASIPWLAILDAKGSKLNDSESPAGNIGFPAEPAAINDFVDRMLKTTAQRLTPDELQALRTALSVPQKTGAIEMSAVVVRPPEPPRLRAAKKRNLPRAPIYNPKANAKDDIATALLTAKRENKRVLIEFGGNWCVPCFRLYDVFKKHAEVSAIVNKGFVLVLVDADTNPALLERYDEQGERGGVPFLTVLNADGKVLRNENTGELEKKFASGGFDIPKVVVFLRQWSSK
jgi:thiol-disulfide isomerase/thioredoxin